MRKEGDFDTFFSFLRRWYSITERLRSCCHWPPSSIETEDKFNKCRPGSLSPCLAGWLAGGEVQRGGRDSITAGERVYFANNTKLYRNGY